MHFKFHSPIVLLLALVAFFPLSSRGQMSVQMPQGQGVSVPVTVTDAVKAPTPNPIYATINSMDALDTKRPLEPGDVVSYRVVQDGNPPLSLKVSDGGELEVPLIGRVRAGGLSCRQVADNIKASLEKVYYKKATVIVGLESVHTGPRGRVFVTGQVRTQGPIELPSSIEKLTVSSAIMQAGGFSDFANKRRVRVMRKTSPTTTEKIIVDVKDIIEGGHLEKDIVLEAGDVIYVPERLINF